MTDCEWTAEVMDPDLDGNVVVRLMDGVRKRAVVFHRLDCDDPKAAAEALAAKINRPDPRPVDGPLRVVRDEWRDSLRPHRFNVGSRSLALTDEEAAPIEAQLAAAVPSNIALCPSRDCTLGECDDCADPDLTPGYAAEGLLPLPETISSVLAAVDAALPPHVAAVLADGLPPGVRVGLVADGSDVPDGWGRYVGPSAGWRQEAGLPGQVYEVRPPVPPAPPQTVTVELPLDVVRVLRDRTLDWLGEKNDETITAACRAALPEGEQS